MKKIIIIDGGPRRNMNTLTPILEEIALADGLVLGSPIYFGDVTGQMRTFLERLCFPWPLVPRSASSLTTPVRSKATTALNWPLFRKRPSGNGAIYIGKRTFRKPLMLDGDWLAIRRLELDNSGTPSV
ncbi:MAG: NAD(P)H-dependent oxidoreductase [Bacteroidales bacterium]|nr:NAD(P)H-dependent oxidoreductase [Bacteroidales bacterium]